MANLRSTRTYLDNNGLYLSISHAFRIAWIRINSSMIARQFGLGRVTIEPPFVLNGRRFIKLGEGFASGPGLWLEAISRYNEASFEPRIIVGRNVSLSHSVHIAATTYVEIGADVLIGSRVLITDHNHGSYSGAEQSSPLHPPLRRPLEQGRKTIVGARVWLGDGVVVTAGAIIGDGAVIGANSVVVGVIPGNSLAAGAPASVIRTYDEQSGQWLRSHA